MRRPPEPPEPSGSVYVQPAPHGFWSGNNNFGFETLFRPEAGNRQQIVKLPEWGEPAVWTVSLGIDYTETGWAGGVGNVRGFEVVGEINYGIGGATQTVLLDWIQGTTFSVPMNAISVNAFYSVLTSESGPTVQPSDLKLRVLLARGELPSRILPTKHAPLLDGRAFATFADGALSNPLARIPRFGKVLFINPLGSSTYTSLVTANNFARFFSGPEVTGSFAVGTVRITESAVLQGIRVPPFAKYVTVENVGGGSNGAVVSLNFELQL
jgi:hypothetical protein